MCITRYALRGERDLDYIESQSDISILPQDKNIELRSNISTKKAHLDSGVLFVIFDIQFLFQVLREKSTSMGKISSRPASMAMVSMTLEKSL